MPESEWKRLNSASCICIFLFFSTVGCQMLTLYCVGGGGGRGYRTISCMPRCRFIVLNMHFTVIYFLLVARSLAHHNKSRFRYLNRLLINRSPLPNQHDEKFKLTMYIISIHFLTLCHVCS
jgi:hypothetical protein